jgi:hypothetical protein
MFPEDSCKWRKTGSNDQVLTIAIIHGADTVRCLVDRSAVAAAGAHGAGGHAERHLCDRQSGRHAGSCSLPDGAHALRSSAPYQPLEAPHLGWSRSVLMILVAPCSSKAIILNVAWTWRRTLQICCAWVGGGSPRLEAPCEGLMGSLHTSLVKYDP